MLLFDEIKCIDIFLKNKNPYVRRAVEDLQNDFKRVSEYGVLPQITHCETDFCIIIEENSTDTFVPLKDESFSIKTTDNKIVISANGYPGTMWAIYTFCEKVLGVNPCYLFDDIEPEKLPRLEIDSINITEAPRGFGFRGIFINDEDLLTAWKDGGGMRHLDYHFYGVTIEESVMNMIVETALRLKFNLIIPASFLDIDNPPEKLLADCVAKRGIYISQHHIEPLGLSSQTFDNYCIRYGKKGSFSYIESPEAMEDAWSFYAQKWAQYDNVVWQTGLRGKNDRPLWQEDNPTDEELRKYGSFISKAYETQMQIIKKATNGKAKHFTSTLWMEGSQLAEKGLLEIPEDTTIVFADAGPNQMFCKEYYTLPRKAGGKYGIYYHLQYYGCGPHLAPQTGIDKLYYNTQLAYKNGDSSYYIMNVSNIREFVFEMVAYSQMAWNTEGFSKEEYMHSYCGRFGSLCSEFQKLITEYYQLLPSLDTKYLSQHLNKYFNYYMGDTPDSIKNFVIKEGIVLSYGSAIIANFRKPSADSLCVPIYTALKKVIPQYSRLYERFKKLSRMFDTNLKRHIEVKWLLHTKTLISVYSWYTALYEAKLCIHKGDSDGMKASVNHAAQSLEEYLQFRKCAEYDNFEHWYRGDLKMNIKQRLFDTKMLLGQTPDL